ncbi:MAG: cell division protein FtsX [Gammaproteobacteria bacterium]
MPRRDPWSTPRPALPALVLGWFRAHAFDARDVLSVAMRQPGLALLIWSLLGIALSFPAGLYLLRTNVAALGADWAGSPGLSVYLTLDAGAEVRDGLAAVLRLRDEVLDVEVVTPEAALAAFEAHAGLGDVLADLPENPLPASLRVAVKPGRSAADLDALAASVTGETGVAEVVIERLWVERVADLSALLGRFSALLGILFGTGALLVTATAIRLALETRLNALRVLQLVGATDAQMRRPLLYLGVWYGAGGAVVAAMLISLALVLVEPPLTRLAGSFGQAVTVRGFDGRFVAVLLAAGVLLGFGGALLAARQRLRRLNAV